MRVRTWTIMAGIAGCACTLSALSMGCNPLAALQFDSDVPLGDGLGLFDVEAGVPATKTGTITIDTQGFSIGSGTLEIPLSAIEVTPTDTGAPKGSVNLQETQELEITVWIDDPDAIDTVCETGDQYGPFTVTLDENLQPLSIDPARVTLTAKTRGLINSGSLSVCVQALSPVTGQIRIQTLTFSLGI